MRHERVRRGLARGPVAALAAGTVLVACALMAMDSPANASPRGGQTQLVSRSTRGIQGDSNSGLPSMGGDGRYIAFGSDADNLVPGDTNGVSDIFVRDRVTGATTRVSVSSIGAQGDAGSYSPSISLDGRYVAFSSDADNLVPGDTNGVTDSFVRDLRTGRTTRVSLSTAGGQGDLPTEGGPQLSADGRYVAFSSDADNLVPGDTNGVTDSFLRDLCTGVTTRVSVSGTGAQSDQASYYPNVSADGRYVVFGSYATNLVADNTGGFANVYLRDRTAGTTALVSRGLSGAPANEYSALGTISADGGSVAFWSLASNLVPGDTNGVGDIYVSDRRSGSASRVNVSTAGAQANDASTYLTISATGRFVAFTSAATNLVPGDGNGFPDVFVRDRAWSRTTLVDVSVSGTQANGSSESPALGITPDGKQVCFGSEATNLVPTDRNDSDDVFVSGTGV